MLHEIFELFRARDPIPFVILAIVCVGWMIILERLVLLQFVYRVNFTKFNVTLKKMLSAGDTERARSFCQSTSKVGLPLIAAKAIEAYETENFRVRMVVSEEALSFMPRIRRRISQLPSLAATAVLLGALAAVYGVWESFHLVDGLEIGLKSFAFSKGLSHALTPLALSLMASVVLMLPYGLVDAIATRLEGEIEHSLVVILNLLAPEMQPVFAQPAAAGGGGSGGGGSGGGGHHSSGGNDSSGSAAYASGSGGGDGSGGGNKGNYDDIASAERVEPVPDEEEII